MNVKKQRLLINNLLNSPDLLGKCIEIIKPSYFEPELIPHVKFLLSYHLKHNANPSIKLMNAECDTDHEYTEYIIPKDEIDHSEEEIESFCKQSAMKDAVFESYELIKDNAFGEIYKKISEALEVSIKKDLGLDVYENATETLERLLEEFEYISCGIKTLDEHFGGGTLPKQFYMVSANSGGGKSVLLSNICNNYSLQGKDVVYVTLELPEDMIFLRQAYIMTDCSHRLWKSKVFEIASRIKELKKYGAGNFKIVRMPIGSNANAIRAYLKQYEIEHGKAPDVLAVDYLDLMQPIGGTKNKSISEQDKEKSEEIYELLHLYDMIGWSASQQNRDALKMDSPDQRAIAGGLTKVNICDYWISLLMDKSMRLNGEMIVHFLKTRYSDAMGKSALLSFSDATLKISDHQNPNSAEELIKNITNKKKSSYKDGLEGKFINKLVETGNLNLPNMEDPENKKLSEKAEKYKSLLADFSDEEDFKEDPNIAEDLLDLMDSLQIRS